MKGILTLLFCLLLTSLSAQEDFLAKQYFNDGEFEKAVVFYEKLVSENPRRTDFVEYLVRCYQQLEAYDKAIAMLQEMVDSGIANPTLYVDLGYTYRLSGQGEAAAPWYQRALEAIESNPNMGYGVGFKFQRYTLLEYALKAYRRAMALNPDLDFNFQIARIYGEQGRVDQMFEAYMALLVKRPATKPNVLRVFESFVEPDAENENNRLLKRVLLTQAQQNPDPLWNELLSWLFVQEGQFGAALNQEKAIYRRAEAAGLDRIFDLGRLADAGGEAEAANEAFEFVAKESGDPSQQLNARLFLIEIAFREGNYDREDALKAYEKLQEEFGYSPGTLQLQVAYAKFLTFEMEQAGKGVRLLKRGLDLPLSAYGEGYLKTHLADLLVYDRKFNEALILYSQVQKRLKNDVMGQEARFKVAQTSFYKGDFDWALTQLKVLRNSTSQLIANDAMQLSLIISDNSLEDSTQTALRKFARADLLIFQQKKTQAREILEEILSQHKGEAIEDEALLRHGMLLAEAGDYSGALLSYRKIIEFYSGGILADDAYFKSAQLYDNYLGEPEKAMENYREIIYRFQDSYYFPEARRRFRILRGDNLN
ncbi:Tetratricopeptide repeat-containing protein [Robiginitalea myxolifaciens]|uniref:Tetratricopeptide repeat-containing protein n=1 Tax=Robiginitalea myxolifaciens TaxID=400055 RepID=A0A1I6FWK5_9FLAO|nr:tetratricopeptide repeat protein [Robiginitalea myxolifaciens]SFR34342.1 Tetratricopeptide repeat-containing protein [Robiginitalea myxolifaciens]